MNIIYRKNNSLKTYFYIIMLFLFILFLSLLILNPTGRQANVIFSQGRDLFADFLNPIIYTHEKNPYFHPLFGGYTKQSLPIAFLILYPFSQLININPNTNIFQLWSCPAAMIAAFMFTLISVMLLFFNLNKLYTPHLHKNSSLLLFTLLMSGIMIFSIERANIIILSSSFFTIFIVNYNSQNIHKRILSVIALSLTAVLKIYPVIIGLLWLYKKRYKDLFYAAVLTLILALLPFFFFEGGFIVNFKQLYSNVVDSQTIMNITNIYNRFSIEHCVYLLATLLNIDKISTMLIISIAHITVIILALTSLITAAFTKEKWKQVCFITLLLIMLPAQSGLYCGLYMFPAIILFFSEEAQPHDKIDYLYVLLFCIFLSPFQFLERYNWLINNAALLIMWTVLLFVETKKYSKEIISKYEYVKNSVKKKIISWL